VTSPAQTVEGQLTALEEQAAADADAAIEEAIVAAGLTAAALAAALPAVTAIIQRATGQAVQLGGALAMAAGGSSRRGRRQGRRAARAGRAAGPRIDVARRVRDSFSAISVGLGRLASDPRAMFDQLKSRVRAVVSTAVTEAASAGVRRVAEMTGASGLMWLTDTDPCLACAGLAGEITPVRRPFPLDRSLRLKWSGYTGWPPMHPRCRCRLRPVWGRVVSEQVARGRRRGADRRARRRTT
jgi:hypothetical protein